MPRFIPFSLLFVGGAIGFGLNQWLHSPVKRPATKTAAPSTLGVEAIPTTDTRLPPGQIKSRIAAVLERGYFREDRHWHELIESISAAEIPALVAMAQVSESSGKFSVLSALYNHWGRLDPWAALASAQKTSPALDERRAYLIYTALLEGWAYADVRAMASWTLQLEHGDLRQRAVNAMSEFADDLDLPTIIRIAREQANRSNNQTFFALWTERDPAAAATAADQMLTGPSRDWIIQTVASAWVRQDPIGATNWFIELDHSSGQTGLANFLQSVARHNPAFAARALDKLPAGYMRLIQAIDVLSIWGKTDPNAALAWLASKPLNSGSIQLYSSLGSAVGSQDLNRAKEMAPQLSNPAVQKTFLDSAYRGFAQADPATAWDTVSQMEPGKIKDQLVKGAIGKLGETDPVGALKRLSSLSDEYSDANLAIRLIAKIGQDDLAAAIEHVQLLPTVESRDDALLQLISHHGGEKFSENALIASAISPGPAATEAMSRIARDYAAYKPDEALNWLNSLPQDTVKDAATVAMLGSIYTTDPSAGMKLALSLPAGKQRESAISTVASMWNQIDASEAIAWAKTLGGADRASALSSLTRSWLSLEPEQATEFLANLSAEDLNSQFLDNSAKNLAQTPSTATRIIDHLPESHLRQSALESVVKDWLIAGRHSFQWEIHPLRNWQSIEPGQAAAWIEKTDLPVETKAELMHIVAGGTLPIE